jgi:hypothetical protein
MDTATGRAEGGQPSFCVSRYASPEWDSGRRIQLRLGPGDAY